MRYDNEWNNKVMQQEWVREEGRCRVGATDLISSNSPSLWSFGGEIRHFGPKTKQKHKNNKAMARMK